MEALPTLAALAALLAVAGICVSAGLVVFSLFMLKRNEWVFKVRSEPLDRDMDAYMRLLPYDDMMRRFWVWDVAKLNQPTEPSQ